MQIIINGKAHETRKKTILELIKELNIQKQVMAAAVNMNVVKKENWDKHILKENDKLELLNFVGGG